MDFNYYLSKKIKIEVCFPNNKQVGFLKQHIGSFLNTIPRNITCDKELRIARMGKMFSKTKLYTSHFMLNVKLFSVVKTHWRMSDYQSPNCHKEFCHFVICMMSGDQVSPMIMIYISTVYINRILISFPLWQLWLQNMPVNMKARNSICL